MFSNYNNPLNAIETNNEYSKKYTNNYVDNCFNQEIYIPFNVKSLNMYCNNQYIIDNLHNNIKKLRVCYTDLNLDNLPNSIKKIFIKNYKKELNNLPNSIEYLELKNYNLKIKKFPKNLKTIKCNKEYEYINDFKDYEVIYH